MAKTIKNLSHFYRLTPYLIDVDRRSHTGGIISAAIEVHRILGPGLKESVYEECLYQELSMRGFRVQRQLRIPLQYKGIVLKTYHRIDLIVEDYVIVELKSVPPILPVHEAQLLWYLRATGKKVGLLFNFYVPLLKDGIVRKLM